MVLPKKLDDLPVFQSGKIITASKGKSVTVTGLVTPTLQPATEATAATVMWDEDGLTVKFDCDDAQIVARPRPRNDPEMWTDDCVEVYLDVNHRHDEQSRWVHFLVSAAGGEYEQQNMNLDYRAETLKTSAGRTATGWQATIRVAWSDLGGAPLPGDVWGINLNRCNYPEKEYQSFSPTGKMPFAAIHRWGHLVFADADGNAPGAPEKMAAPHARLAAQAAADDLKQQRDFEPFDDLQPLTKTHSVFCRPEAIATIRSNAAKHPWARDAVEGIIAAAAPWLAMDDEQLWSLMFGPTITRAWDVWYDGHCPACKKPVVMYNWKYDGWKHPWKMQCPCCQELFPKNDFAAFYRSGMDERSVFDPKRADRSLLFNGEHPDPDDPLHRFGVDDGEGYMADGKRWRFIGAFLIYGQWKQLVLGGISHLSAAYMVTGEPGYAHKTGVLLDRVADLYPTFDFATQAKVYEHSGSDGYVSMWHDACAETEQMTMAYDRVFDALKDDRSLVEFLAGKAASAQLPNKKRTFHEVQHNIEDGILFDALRHYPKIHSNYPRAQVARSLIRIVLSWPENRGQTLAHIDAFVADSTKVDGITGEKGLAGYSIFTLCGLADFLAELTRIDPTFLPALLARQPALRESYRFHIDTFCLGRYYPEVGDSGWFGRAVNRYVGASFRPFNTANKTANPTGHVSASIFSFFWAFHQATGEPGYVQALYQANGRKLDGLPHDLQAKNPEEIQRGVAEVIARHGADFQMGSVNKEQWHLAVLRSGAGRQARAAWLDYDTGGSHGHFDGMNLGLFAHGLDLMPDFGYPPLQFGDRSPQVEWYKASASHNTVVVNREDQKGHILSHRGDGFRSGDTTLWGIGQTCRVIRIAGAEIVERHQFERTIALADISENAFYLFDVFRVVGGQDHAKFTHSHFGRVTTNGFKTEPAPDSGHSPMMRNFRGDPDPSPGWQVEWQIEDRYHLIEPGREIRLRYTSLTQGAGAYVCEGFVVPGHYNQLEEAWIPRVMERRQCKSGVLATTFVAVLEPFEGKSSLVTCRRLELQNSAGKPCGDEHVAVEISLADGRRDVWIALDVENPLNRKPDWRVEREVRCDDGRIAFDGEFIWIRFRADGPVERLQAGGFRSLRVGPLAVEMKARTPSVELSFTDNAVVATGSTSHPIERITMNGHELAVRS